MNGESDWEMREDNGFGKGERGREKGERLANRKKERCVCVWRGGGGGIPMTIVSSLRAADLHRIKSCQRGLAKATLLHGGVMTRLASTG